MRTVAVPGGDLAYEVLQGTSEPVLAVHGISSHRRLWDWLHVEAPDLTLIAVDLRGRGDSVGVTGPSSVQQHAADLVAVLDDLGLDRVHVVGMSMGGFVSVQLATLHPERVKSLVLVDGGFPFAPPPGLTPDSVGTAFADRLARLDQTWESVAAYADFFTASTGPLLDPADPVLHGYLAHDLVDGRVRLAGDVLVDDARSIYFGDSPWQQVTAPVRWTHAEFGIGSTAPMYPAELVAAYAPACVATRFLPGLDHAGSIMTKAGAVATAELLSEALG